MMSGNPPDLSIYYLAHSLASDVVGFAAARISEMMEGDDRLIMEKWGKAELSNFIDIYLSHLVDAYKMQIKSINKFKEDENV